MQKWEHWVGKALQATICAQSNSIAAIYLYEKHPWNGRAKLFIIDFTDIVYKCGGVCFPRWQAGNIAAQGCEAGLTYYFAVYKNAEWPDLSELSSLYRMLLADIMQMTHEEDGTDGLVLVSKEWSHACRLFCLHN